MTAAHATVRSLITLTLPLSSPPARLPERPALLSTRDERPSRAADTSATARGSFHYSVGDILKYLDEDDA